MEKESEEEEKPGVCALCAWWCSVSGKPGGPCTQLCSLQCIQDPSRPGFPRERQEAFSCAQCEASTQPLLNEGPPHGYVATRTPPGGGWAGLPDTGCTLLLS